MTDRTLAWILSLQAALDQLSAELHDPDTSPDQQAAIRSDLTHAFLKLQALVEVYS